MKTNIILITCLFVIISGIRGLELTLDLPTPALSGQRSVCGVLTCEEHYAAETGQSQRSQPSRTISSMSVFRIPRSAVSGDNGDSETPMASLNLLQPEIDRESNGVKVNGALEDEQAKLRLEMTREEDCSAQYSCEVRTSDGQGNELVQTNRIHQAQERHEGWSHGGLMTSVASLQQLALLQQQVTLLGQSLEGTLGALEGKLGGFVGKLDALEGKVTVMETRLDSGQSRLEDKISSVKDGVESAKDEINNNIQSRVVDKLCQLETKLPDASEATTVVGSDKLGERLLELKEQQEAAMLNALAISNSTSEVVSALQEYLGEIFPWEQKNNLKFENLTAAMLDMLKPGNDVCLQVQSSLSLLANDLQTNFEHLWLRLDNRSDEMVSVVRNLSTDTNVSATNNSTPSIAPGPIDCRKGMGYLPPDTRYPYPVVYPSGESGLEFPYLCDTVTEGGGWVVIQRRTTGYEDFYRGWYWYKQGFGSLDDDFWLGNDNIHALTQTGKFELRVDLKYNRISAFAHYDSFSLEDEENNYTLRLGAYDGTAGDDLGYHNGRPFSTYDMDNDDSLGNPSCAERFSGAWWYGSCYHSNLNGRWGMYGDKGMRWRQFSTIDSVSYSEMKIRRVSSD